MPHLVLSAERVRQSLILGDHLCIGGGNFLLDGCLVLFHSRQRAASFGCYCHRANARKGRENSIWGTPRANARSASHGGSSSRFRHATGGIALKKRSRRFGIVALSLAFSTVAGTTVAGTAQAQTAITGLDFPGSAGVTRTMRFKFTNPQDNGLPIYGPGGNGVTYIWRAYPRQQPGYYTAFFWGNDDGQGNINTFTWVGGGVADTYYGAHPYPRLPDVNGHDWEISTEQNDYVNGAVMDDRWYTQALRVWSDATGKHHEFYWDLPNTDDNHRVTRDSPTSWGNRNPPAPALTWGDAPWNPGKEVWNGILRGFQIYSALLSLSDIQSEATTPLSTSTGRNNIWYLNVNPTPTDISDKSGRGHHPVWVGSERPALYTDASGPVPLTVTRTGSGTVTSAPAGIDCGGLCASTFEAGTTVTLTAMPASGAVFAGWSGAECAGTGSCAVTLTSAATVTATFTSTPVTLTVVRVGLGNGSVTSTPDGIVCGTTCSSSFSSGTVVTLTAIPATGSTFVGWSGGGCSGTGPCIVTATAATTVTSTFALQSFRLTVAKAGTGAGTVTSTPAGVTCGTTCSAPYDYDTLVTLTATPAIGATFMGWSGGGCSGTGPCAVRVTSAVTVTATFAFQSFTLAVTKAGTGSGTVVSVPAGIICGTACSTAYSFGTIVTLTATPAAGSIFTGWGGACSGSNGICVVTMIAARSVTANIATSFSGSFTDDPLLVQTTVIKAVHITELRSAIDSLRELNRLPAFAWTDSTITPGTTPISAVHVLELRTALDEVYQALERPLPVYSYPTIVAGRTVTALDVGELRAACRQAAQ